MRRALFSKPGRRLSSRCWLALAALVPALATAQEDSASPDPDSECTCLWQGSFVDVQADTDVVVAGTVREIKGNAMDLTIEQKLRGDPFFDEIRIWLKDRNYCRPTVDTFPVGSRWVMALTRIREVPAGGFDPLTPNRSYGRVGDYILSECGGYWLSVTGEAVTGNLVDAPRWSREPEMQPVLIPLIEAFVQGRADTQDLRDAAQEDPAVDALMLDTRAFLRGDVPPDLP